MAESLGWLERYTDESKSELIERQWLRMPLMDGVSEVKAAFTGELVTDPENWEVEYESQGSWIDGQFEVRKTVRAKA